MLMESGDVGVYQRAKVILRGAADSEDWCLNSCWIISLPFWRLFFFWFRFCRRPFRVRFRWPGWHWACRPWRCRCIFLFWFWTWWAWHSFWWRRLSKRLYTFAGGLAFLAGTLVVLKQGQEIFSGLNFLGLHRETRTICGELYLLTKIILNNIYLHAETQNDNPLSF